MIAVYGGAAILLAFAGYLAFLFGMDPGRATAEAGVFLPIVVLLWVMVLPAAVALALAGAIYGAARNSSNTSG